MRTPLSPSGRCTPAVIAVLLLAGAAAACAGRAAAKPRTEPDPGARPPRPTPAVRLDRPAESAESAADPGRSRPVTGRYHRLKKGQTLYALARLHGVPVDRLLAVNGIHDARKVPAGSLILIPGVRSVTPDRAATPQGAAAPLDTATPGAPGPPPALLSLVWPLEGPVTGGYGARGKKSHHDGIDIDGHRGDIVRSVAGGRVVRAGDEGRYGRTVVIDHGDGITTLYAHASAILVEAGDTVSQDQPIAKVGGTGNARGTHLHFEVRRDGRPVDPIPLLRDGILGPPAR